MKTVIACALSVGAIAGLIHLAKPKPETRYVYVDKPVVQEKVVYVNKPVIKEVVREVPKEVIKVVDNPEVKTVYVDKCKEPSKVSPDQTAKCNCALIHPTRIWCPVHHRYH
jgi:hypothetical protein